MSDAADDFECATTPEAGFVNAISAGWQATVMGRSSDDVHAGSAVRVVNGDELAGGLNSSSGQSFVGLGAGLDPADESEHNSTAAVSLERRIFGLEAGQIYVLSFVAACRPGYNASAVLEVFTDELLLGAASLSAAGFEPYRHTFTAASASTTIRFSNGVENTTAFLDAVDVIAGVYVLLLFLS